MRMQGKVQEDELRRKKKGVTYETGAFNELSLCSKPQTSSKKRKRK